MIETPKPPRSIFTPATLRNYLNETLKTGDTFEVCQALVRKICPDETVKIDDDLTLIAVRYTGGATIEEGEPAPGPAVTQG